jgi:hypothetical protein
MRKGDDMTREEQFRKNNELFELFMQQVLETPEFTESIPEGAEIIFLPTSDPELYQANLKLGKARRSEGHEVVYINIELVPQVRTIFVPRLELTEVVA